MIEVSEFRENRLLAALPETERATWSQQLEAVDMPLGKVLYESGNKMTHVYFPTTSIVSLLYVMEDGASAEIAVVGNEGIVGISLFMGGESTPSRAVVQSGGKGLRLRANILMQEFSRFGAVLHLLLRYTQALITARHDASIAWIAFVANSSALIAAYLEPAANQAIFTDPRSVVAWGPPNASRAQAVDGGYRLTGRWDFASGCRQARWMGAHCHVFEADGALRLNRFGRPTVRTLLFPADEATLLDTWQTIGLRGTASDSYCVDELFVSEAFSTTREDPTLRRERGRLYAFTMQCLYATGVAAVGFGIARAMLSEFIALASRKAPRGLARLADNAVVQAEVARAEARLGSARAYLIETLSTIYANADEVAPIEVADRARVRLACTNAIQGAAEVADFAYKAAGVDAIFPGSPFERRFRDMHTLSQQIQARGAHFESVGQILLGVPPEVFL